MNTWTEQLGHSRLRSFTDEDGHFWLEQNADKRSKWAKLARQGHDIAWEFGIRRGVYRAVVDRRGDLYTLRGDEEVPEEVSACGSKKRSQMHPFFLAYDILQMP
jgi:hypothetical protein